MTESEYVFQQDVKERKQQVTGARHRKCGSKSKKCTLPSDKLTAKQMKEKNGSVMTMDLRRKYSINEFNKFSDELKGVYIEELQKKFQVGLADIADMFMMRPEAFRNYAMMHNITVQNCIPSDSNLQAWNAWRAGEPIPERNDEEILPKTYSELKAMDDDELETYLHLVTERFQVSVSRISRFMCDKTPSVLPALLEKRGIPFKKGINGTPESRKAFHDWLAGKPVVDTPVEVEAEPEKSGSVQVSNVIDLDLTGDPRAVADKMVELAKLLNAGEITIKITAIK